MGTGVVKGVLPPLSSSSSTTTNDVAGLTVLSKVTGARPTMRDGKKGGRLGQMR